MSVSREHTLPLDALLAVAGLTDSVATQRTGSNPCAKGVRNPQSALARRLDIPLRTVQRWARHGLQWWSADRAAIALGVHPCEVWGGAWWALPIDPDRVEQAEAKFRERRRERRELVRDYELMYRARTLRAAG